jgi:hypothetical protein
VRRAGHSSRGVLPSVVCLKSVIVKPRKMRWPRPPRGCRAIGKKILMTCGMVSYDFGCMDDAQLLGTKKNTYNPN